MEKYKRDKLTQIADEKTLREDVLRVLLSKMGYKGVTITHGTGEHGKDLVFHSFDKITNQKNYYAVVAKVGKLKGGTDKAPENIINIQRQIQLAFKIPYLDVAEKRKIEIKSVWVITNSTISEKAQQQILDMFGEHSDIMSRNVEFVAEGRLLEWLNEYWPDYFKSGDPFVREYCTVVADRYEKLLELKSLGSKKVRHLFEVFIEPTIIEEREDIVKKRNTPDIVSLSSKGVLKDKNNYWLTGTIGSGKSTLLRKLILMTIENVEKNKSDFLLPIALRFKELISEDNKNIIPIEDKILETINTHNKHDYSIDPIQWLNDGKYIVFVDGFDEICKHELMENVLSSINKFMEEHPSIKIIATSRELGIERVKAQLKKFHNAEIRPLNFKQMKRFVSQWFNERELAEKIMVDVLKKTVYSNKLPKTPMVLTLLAILFDEEPIKELPANLTELYSMFTQLYLGRWDAERNIDNLFEYNIKSNILMDIASWMHQEGRDRVSEDAMKYRIDEYSRDRSLDINADQLIEELIERSQILYRDESGYYAFKHLSFQEYFASLKWGQRVPTVTNVVNYSLNPWWQNVVFFYVGKKKDTPEILKAVMEAEPKNAPDAVNKILNLGQLLQAAYLTKDDIKMKVLEKSIRDFCEVIPSFLSEIQKQDMDMKISEPLLILASKYMFANNYSSITLRRPMEEVFLGIKETINLEDRYDFMKMYFLAYVLAILDKKEYLEDLATSPSGFDPLFALLMRIDFSELGSEYDIKLSHDVIKKLQKRIKRSWKYLESLSTS